MLAGPLAMARERAFLGITSRSLSGRDARNLGLDRRDGALVQRVYSDTAADEAGLEKGDVIIEFDGKEVADQTALRNIVAATTVGKKVKVKIIRSKKPKTLSVKIDEQPKDMAALGQESETPEEHPSENTALAGLDVREITPEIAERLGLPPDSTGVVVTDVNPNSGAAAAGLQPGDLITEINRKAVRNMDDFKRIAGKLEKDEEPLLLVKRRSGKFFLILKS
jgi:serine protease Do